MKFVFYGSKQVGRIRIEVMVLIETKHAGQFICTTIGNIAEEVRNSNVARSIDRLGAAITV